jgi:Transposase IS66 family
MKKHKRSVSRFYRWLTKTNFETEVGVGYKKRFEKNKDKLFTFLDYDDVPWNNNAAEHAIKAFATLRRVFGGSSTERGIQDYLVLLSVCETCRYRGINFWEWLCFVFWLQRRGRLCQKSTASSTPGYQDKYAEFSHSIVLILKIS